jgi:hypothetical protein
MRKDKDIIKGLNLLFYRKKVAKSSVQGFNNGAPLLKTDRIGDPAASSRFTEVPNLTQ